MGLPDLTAAIDRLAAVVAGIGDDQLDDPTPCDGTTVTGLVDHVGGLALAFTWAAQKSVDPNAPAPGPSLDATELEPGWRTEIPARLAALAAAWRDPMAWTGITGAGGVELPGEVAGIVALDEVVIHGWDLARATGQPYDVDEPTLRVLEAFVAGFDGPDDGTLFGPRVAVPDDAPLLDRVLGLTGRDPRWRPATVRP